MDAPIEIRKFNDASFENWQQALNTIYEVKNENREPAEMWLRTVSDASKVGEAIRKGDAYEAMVYLIHAMGWIITTTNKLLKFQYNGEPALQTADNKPHSSITQIVLAKYPTVCPVCQKESCHCPIRRKTVEQATPDQRKLLKAQEKERRRQELLSLHSEIKGKDSLPGTITGLSKMLDDIYGQVHFGENVQNITFHFLEEVGEVAWCLIGLEEGLRYNSKDKSLLSVQLSEEIADVIAWSFAIIAKLANSADQASRLMYVFHPNSGEIIDKKDDLEKYSLLARWLWNVFYDKKEGRLSCPSCQMLPCNC